MIDGRIRKSSELPAEADVDVPVVFVTGGLYAAVQAKDEVFPFQPARRPCLTGWLNHRKAYASVLAFFSMTSARSSSMV